MKIGIMTFPNTNSYGAEMQMYALYRAVENLGAQPEIINYCNSYMKAQSHTRAFQSSGMKKKLRLLLKSVLHLRQTQVFRRFEKRMRLHPENPISTAEELSELAERYDGVICGSDQVWNPDITGMDMGYFLDFCGGETRRIAYAPSFGITEFSGDFQKKIKPLLNRFNWLSAREKEGQQLLERLTGRDVSLVLDPTFLLSEQQWTALEQEHPEARGDYILYYTVLGSESLLRFCLQLAEKENKQVVFVGGNPVKRLLEKNKRIRYACDVSPEQWLYLIHHASCVVTNSFHGTAFAIHYKKEFFLEFSSYTNSRLEQIIRLTGLEDRVVGGKEPAPIDYQKVYDRLADARQRSSDYLKEAVG